MKKKGVIIGVIVLVIVIIAGAFIGGYNGLVEKQTAVEQKYSDIQVQLQRRADLIPNFVNTVKGYTDYEQKTLTAVTQARSAVNNATDAKALSDANDQLDKSISVWVNAVTEAYPDLKANTQYVALQDELAGTENRVAVARKDYNDAATTYNKSVRSFPTSILAGMFGFEKSELFSASSSAQEAPTVSF